MSWNIPRQECNFPTNLSIRINNGGIPSAEEITFEVATDPTKKYLRTGTAGLQGSDAGTRLTSIGLGREAACHGISDWKSGEKITDERFSVSRTVDCVINISG